jgi:hypothetical protein
MIQRSAGRQSLALQVDVALVHGKIISLPEWRVVLPWVHSEKPLLGTMALR